MHASRSTTLGVHLLPVLLIPLACTPTATARTGMGEATVSQAARAAATADTGVFDDWMDDRPGARHHIRPSDLPTPTMANRNPEADRVDPTTVVPQPPTMANPDPEMSIGKPATVVAPPTGAMPRVPDGFAVRVFASGLKMPRRVRVAPNGDIFVSESGAGRVLVYPASSTGGANAQPRVFAENLDRPYGIAFVPADNPQHVYVAAANEVVRYPYRGGASQGSGPAEVIVANLPTKRHWTKDLAVSRDGRRLFLSVGSASNLGWHGIGRMSPEVIRQYEQAHGRGAAWGEEEDRAMVRVIDLERDTIRNYATGLRNCSGLTMQPGTDNLWCVVNERDHLGPNMVPDFMVHVREGAFYGWPWYTVGDREDPARRGERPDLRGDVQVPEVLIQPHSSSLGVVFYDRDAFPAEYRGDAFVTLHGSHSRPTRTGFKVIRVRMQNGRATGAYEDFMTGFVLDNEHVWGRPAGIAVTRDGGLLVTDDANGRIYLVTRR